MRRLLIPLLSLLALALLGASLAPARAVAPTGATMTYLPMAVKPSLAPPVVSNAHYTVFAVNYFACSNEVTLFHMKMDYLDPNGDVTEAASSITVSVIGFNVQRTYSGDDILIRGDGSQGVAQAAVCLGFGNYDSLQIGLELTDATGRKSNLTQMTVNRPPGAKLDELGASALPTLGTVQRP